MGINTIPIALQKIYLLRNGIQSTKKKKNTIEM